MTNAEVVRKACQIIWTDGDVSRISEFYAGNFQASYPRTDWGQGLEGIRVLAENIRATFPDYSEQIDELIEAGEFVIVRLTLRGTQTGPLEGLPASGKKVEFNDVTICRVEDGKISEQRGLSDHFALFSQLGLIAMPDQEAGESS